MVNMIYAFLRVQEKELVSLTERLQTRNNKSVLPFDFRPVQPSLPVQPSQIPWSPLKVYVCHFCQAP